MGAASFEDLPDRLIKESFNVSNPFPPPTAPNPSSPLALLLSANNTGDDTGAPFLDASNSGGSAYYTMLLLLTLGVMLLLLTDAGCMARTNYSSTRLSRLDIIYLPAFAVCASADWLQGPYVYALYASYGFDRLTINVLFTMGFLSAAAFGPVVGGLADRYGRKRSCIIGYCFLYGLGCLSKHFRSLPILLAGRVLGGAATSVLFSAFEAWLVAQHEIERRSNEELSSSLSKMYFLNGLAGILMGLLAQAGADAAPLGPLFTHTSSVSGPDIVYVGGDITPFDLSLGFLVAGALIIGATWGENYASSSPSAALAGVGTSSSALAAAVRASSAGAFGGSYPSKEDSGWEVVPDPSMWGSGGGVWAPNDSEGSLGFAGLGMGPWLCLAPFQYCGRACSRLFRADEGPLLAALSRMVNQPLLLLLMAASSTMEGAMYAFVLEWTPAVSSTAGKPPLGIIFAAFMVAYMGGSTCASIMLRSGMGGGRTENVPTTRLGGALARVARLFPAPTPAFVLVIVCAASLCSFGAAFLMLAGSEPGDKKPPSVAFSVFLACCCFEFCLGAYMPTIASIKARHVPEELRATIYGIFRVPLNLIVVSILMLSLSSATTFLICTALLVCSLVAALASWRIIQREEALAAPPSTGLPFVFGEKERSPLVGSGSSTC